MKLLAFAMNTERRIKLKIKKVWKKQNSLKIRSTKFNSELRITLKKENIYEESSKHQQIHVDTIIFKKNN